MNTLLDQLFDAFFQLDGEGRFTGIHGKTPELFGRAAGELMGNKIWELFPDLMRGDLPEKIESVMRHQRVERVSGPLIKRGWLEVTIAPEAEGVVCFVRDVSVYQQTQPGPTHDENGRIIFDALLESIPEAIIIADASAPPGQYPFLVASHYATQSLGIPRQTLLQYNLADLLRNVQFIEAGSEVPTTIENHPLTRYIEHGAQSEDWDYTLRNKQGMLFSISVKGGPVRNQDGKIIAGILSWMDISPRKQQEQRLVEYARRLEQSSSDLEVFSSTAAHDLQAPLRRVKGFSEILMKRYRDQLAGEGMDHLERIYASANEMQRLMYDLVDYARVGAQVEQPEPVDLNATIRGVLADLEMKIRSLNAGVTVEDLPVVLAGPARMQQLFHNLIDNALKFHPAEAAPRVRVYAAGMAESGGLRVARIAVEDQGIGFDMSYFDHILQPFQRLHSKREYEGSGIGLAICCRIAEHYGGTLSADSTPGQGSTFYVTLPLERAEGEEDSSRAGLGG